MATKKGDSFLKILSLVFILFVLMGTVYVLGNKNFNFSGEPVMAATTTSVQLGNLFVAVATPSSAPTLDPAVIRDRYVKIRTLSAKIGDVVKLNFFSDATYKGRIREITNNNNGYVEWRGNIVGIPNSYFYVINNYGTYIVHAASPMWVYEVSLYKGKIYRVVQIDQSKLGAD